MIDKDILLLDLGGTLTDPKIDITRPVVFALDKAGIHVENPDDLCAFIGSPLRDMSMELYSFDEAQALQAIADYRVYLRKQGMLENVAYPGIRELLEALQKQGKTLLVATSKPEEFACTILKHSRLDPYMLDTCGTMMDSTRSDKVDVIAYAVQKYRLSIERCVMIGDRQHDIIGREKNGMRTIGVLYGYGSCEELKEAGADYIVEDVQSLLDVLKRGDS